jgi:hypothetical protein
MLNAARIAERKNRPRKIESHQTSFGEEISIRQLNLLERDDYNLSVIGDDGKVDVSRLRGNKARLIALCLVDEEGKKLLTEQDVIEAFNVNEIDEINDLCAKANGLQKDAVAVEAGNS